ncbi:MAG TPA: bifunctional UDP-N-acetylglucosamine diphosphorylase/glucosamine-1-phosphate N-acetyltransferase GlmU, partial [Candidatus Acidoferrales bacterium]|nr:bifunctional UDP-N-acetylglucosamine diphosphorylase/glucosamine-1-phosphate N-acetyltransferase GlmU [Candidatus Acidoferrales bacterium]
MKRQRPLAAIVLAAGKGTRMKSTLPKVLHPVAGRSILGHMLGLLNTIGASKIVVVTAPDQASVADEAHSFGASSVVQAQQLGTGDAARAALPALEGFTGDVMVHYGDHPLFTPPTFEKLLAARASGAEIAIIGFRPEDPAAYGRAVLLPNGDLDRIVEFKDASEAERRLDLCSAGGFTLDANALRTYLAELDNKNAQHEFYLTGIVDAARRRKLRCVVVEASAEEVLGVNSRAELALVESVMQKRLRERAMENGATLIDPSTTWFSYDTQLGRDVTVGPNVFFAPKVRVADNVRINAFCHFEDCTIGEGAIVGPYARLRPGAQIGRDVHIGNFVEVKKAVIEDGAKANHLTYIGDARVGAGSNIGAGTITCNYDGFDKYVTDIGRNVFIGSNSALIAPIK